MKLFSQCFTPATQTTLLAIGLFSLAMSLPVYAGPGAHGPNGEHLDSAPNPMGLASTNPRLETHSDLFELVATFYGSELSMMIDRYETNEPVLGATVEAEVDGVKGVAKFHADHGDYAIDDPAFLQVLSSAGTHALVFTINAGDDADLLEGTMAIGAAPVSAHRHDHDGGHAHDDHGHDHGEAPNQGLILALGGGAVVALLAWLFGRRSRS